VALVVLVVAGAGTIAWLLTARSPDDPIRVLVASRLAATAAPAPRPDPAAVATTLPTRERDPGLVEVCGLGWVEKKADAGSLDPALLVAIPGIETALDDIVGRLRRSPDAIARAAALVLAMSVDPVLDDPASLREQLAERAATTDDPRLYALAFRLCTRAPTNGSCALLSAAQWARLDAGNGEPWLFILADAASRGDRAMVDEALYRIGSAARFDDRFFDLTGAVAAQAGTSDADLMAAQMLWTILTGVAAAQWLPLQGLDACRDAELADTNRRQVCEAVATTLAERSDSMLFALSGARIGHRVGWDEERVVAVRALSLALADSWSAVPDQQHDGMSYSCDGVRAILARAGRLAEVGEPQVARDWIAASGKSLESFARVARDQALARAAREAQQASVASAASAASSQRPGG
jgi:hypothetical protein